MCLSSKSGLPTANASFSKSLQDRCFLPGAHACCCTFNRTGLRSDRHARLFSDCLHVQAPFYFQSGRLLTRSAVVNLRRDGARHASLPFKTLKGHSFGNGAASSAAAMGLPNWLIKVLSRWSSDCYQLYICTPHNVLLSAALQMASVSSF